MVNQQLVDYIKQQLQAGVDKEMVRKTLSDAGWQAPDVDDSMKAAEPAAAATTTPVSGILSAVGASSPSAQPASEPAKIDPAAAMGGSMSEPASSKSKFFSRPATASDLSTPASASPASVSSMVDEDDDEDHPSTKKFVMSMIVMGLVIVILAGALAFVYFNLNSQLKAAQNGAMTGAGDGMNQSALQGQVTELTAERDALATQVAETGAERDALEDELGFLVVPPGVSTSTPITVTVSGALSGNASTTFVLTTAHNVRVQVANSTDAAVSAALTPLASDAATVQLTGTHLPASTSLTVTAVNGAAL